MSAGNGGKSELLLKVLEWAHAAGVPFPKRACNHVARMPDIHPDLETVGLEALQLLRRLKVPWGRHPLRHVKQSSEIYKWAVANGAPEYSYDEDRWRSEVERTRPRALVLHAAHPLELELTLQRYGRP